MDKRLIICYVIKSLYPKIIFSLVIEPNIEVHGFGSDVEMNTLREYKISYHISYANTLEILMEGIKKDIEECKTYV